MINTYSFFEENLKGAYTKLEELSPNGIAKRFIKKYSGRFFYIRETKTWLHWNGKKYQICDGAFMMRILRKSVDDLPSELEKNQIGIIKNRFITKNDIIKCSEKLSSYGVLNQIAKILPSCDGAQAGAGDFDSNPELVNCVNGIVNARTGELIPFNPELKMSQIASADYDQSASGFCFNQFVLEICDGDKDLALFLQVLCGYFFTGVTFEQKLFIFYGLGANGKSLLLSILLKIAGDYGIATPSSTLLTGHAGTIRNDIARLVNARLVVATETSRGQRFDEAGVKALTGEDQVVSRKLYHEYFGYIPKFKVVLAVNTLPRIIGNDKGIKRRLCIIPFNRTFEKEKCDKHLKTKLLSEATGIFAWIMEGAKVYLEHGLPECKAVSDATASYLSGMDEVQNFLNDKCTVDQENSRLRVPVATLYSAYKNWAVSNGIEPLGKNIFGESVKAKNIHQNKSGGVRHWAGLTVKI